MNHHRARHERLIDAATARSLPRTLERMGIAGAATYDALVALAARRANLPLLTNDRRAAATYAAVHVRVELLGTRP